MTKLVNVIHSLFDFSVNQIIFLISSSYSSYVSNKICSYSSLSRCLLFKKFEKSNIYRKLI